ncbi:MAG: flagellar biosynthetic protein FliO [Bacillota bacterium]
MNYIWETFKMAFYLVLVIGFILAIYYLIRRRFDFSSSKELKIVDSMRLLNGENIYLIKVYDEIVMLGGSKDELNFLRSWPISELDLELEDLEKDKVEKTLFKDKLMTMLNQKNKNDKQKKSKDNSGSDQNEQ